MRLAGQSTHMSRTMRSNPSPLRFYPGAVHCRFQEFPFPQNFRLLAVANLCHLCNNLCCWYCFSWQLNYTTQLKTMEPAFASSMVFLFKDFCYSPCLLFKYNSHCSSFTNYAIEFNMCSKALGGVLGDGQAQAGCSSVSPSWKNCQVVPSNILMPSAVFLTARKWAKSTWRHLYRIVQIAKSRALKIEVTDSSCVVVRFISLAA